ncbi:UNVERIFIED_CONTAM: hypothetical protein H355_013074 [Colinus virginianus]|nr:hypothetical protein H355_013074 [Colinus virginianus]
MDDFQAGEETSFVVDEVSNIIKEAIESAIGGNVYQHNKVNQWTTSVVEQSLSQLTKLGKPFKYIGYNTLTGDEFMPRTPKLFEIQTVIFLKDYL